MGFNFSGIAINKNYSNNVKELAEAFGWNLVFEKEIYFEQAMRWTDEGICDIYFSENGTLVFMNVDFCLDGWCIEGGNTFTFALSDTSMAFNLNYCEGNELKRSVMEVNGERMTDEGEPLKAETEADDLSEAILDHIGEVLGQSFWSIEPDEKSYRYHIR